MTELYFFGKIARFHHIGIAVRSIKAVNPKTEIIEDPVQKVRVAFVTLNDINIELVEPFGENSPVAESLKKGIKLLHICYEVPDIEKATQECRNYGLHRISPTVQARAFNSKIAWVYGTEYGLFELLENKDLLLHKEIL